VRLKIVKALPVEDKLLEGRGQALGVDAWLAGSREQEEKLLIEFERRRSRSRRQRSSGRSARARSAQILASQQRHAQRPTPNDRYPAR
jgi:hypothetical protein